MATKSFELAILIFVRSLRESNFQLYIEALDKLIPWFFALNHPNYSRWIPVHLRDMLNLKRQHPSVSDEFESGKFVVKKTHRSFSAMAIDQAHEQNNCIVKEDGGAVGLTENTSQLTRWMVSGPEIARVIGEFQRSLEDIKQQQSKGPDMNHHEQVKGMQASFKKQVEDLCHTVEEMGNPFLEKTNDLLVLDTRDIVGDEVASTIANIQQIGKEQYTSFVEERLDKRTTSLFSPVKRNKLPLFSCSQAKTATKEQQQIQSLKKNCSLFSRLYVSCQVRDGDIDEFFSHENQSYPPALSKFGVLRTGTKADLTECLEKHCPDAVSGTPVVDAIMLDGAAVVNILKPGAAKTFLEYSEIIYLPYLESQLQNTQRLDVIWDEYLAASLKSMTRQHRGKGTRRRVRPNVKIPSNWAEFLRIDENKTELFAFLAEQTVTIKSDQKEVYSTIGKLVLSNSGREDTELLQPCTHEEADTRLLLHVADASARGCQRVMIRTVDTDVLVLSIALFPQMSLNELWLAFGTGKHFRFIPAHTIANSLGTEKAKSMLMLHAFTGCDQTSFFVQKGKKTAWETVRIFPEVLDTFVALGKPATEETLQQHMPTLEQFVILLYDRTSTSTSVNNARKELFTQKGRSIDLIPPTYAALYQHAKRAAYQAGHVWGQALLRDPELPDPCKWGWIKQMRGKSHVWEPVWSSLPEASKTCQELLKCGCNPMRDTNVYVCKGNCKCSKADLECTSYCKCRGNCERT